MWKVEPVTLAEKTRYAVRKYVDGERIAGAGFYDYEDEAQKMADNLNEEEGYNDVF